MLRKDQYTLARVTCPFVPTSKYSCHTKLWTKKLFMCDYITSKIEGQRNSALKKTSEEKCTLNYLLHALDIKKNLSSRFILSKKDFRFVFESNKFVFIKNGMHVGKRYMTNSLFTIITSKANNNNVFFFFCLFYWVFLYLV